VTEAAGPCLASLKNHQEKLIAVVVLKVASMNLRYDECESITDWVYERYNQIQSIHVQMRNSVKKRDKLLSATESNCGPNVLAVAPKIGFCQPPFIVSNIHPKKNNL